MSPKIKQVCCVFLLLISLSFTLLFQQPVYLSCMFESAAQDTETFIYGTAKARIRWHSNKVNISMLKSKVVQCDGKATAFVQICIPLHFGSLYNVLVSLSSSCSLYPPPKKIKGQNKKTESLPLLPSIFV